MSGKVSEKKLQKERIMERMNTHVIDSVTSSQKKKLKPYTKPPFERQFGSAGNVPHKPFDIPPHKLVEIYHNNAAKESDSEEEKNRAKNQMKIKTDLIPHLNINGNECGDYKEMKNCSRIIEDVYREPHAPRTCYTNKSYELPTIASKMKQAVKLDFNMFNFKAIPFCPVSSTTPSHNIGINIQQVMSIIKTRQPVQGISPTLAHNINLAAEKLNNDPLTSLVSSMTSKMGYGRSSCPLNKYSMNFGQLEEMARAVPEENIGDGEETNNGDGSPTGPSGDTQARSTAGPHEWVSNCNKKDCCCANTHGHDFRHVYSKYRNQPSSYNPKNHYMRHPPNSANLSYRPMNRESVPRRNSRLMGYVEDCCKYNPAVYMRENMNVVSPLNGKDKNLKDVLMNLHDEFEEMDKRYEALSVQVASGDDRKELKDELELLDRKLSKKENEITIVMALYKEVISLKQQVKELKKFSADNSMNRQSKLGEYRSKTAQHLTKLLHHIHHQRKQQ